MHLTVDQDHAGSTPVGYPNFVKEVNSMTATVANAYVNVINASYQPLGATKLNRAIALVNRGDAVVEEADPHRLLRHERGSFPWPLVIRLLRMIKVPVVYGPAQWSKSGVLRRDGHICSYCGDNNATTIDHIIPKAQGGRDAWENTCAACQPCNATKGPRTPEEAGMTLLIVPIIPQRLYYQSSNRRTKKK